MISKNKRFIAGAACPKCHEVDSLIVDMDDQHIECVECGFSQSEADRDAEHAANQSESVTKIAPKKVDVSTIIRVKNVKDD